MHILSSVPNWCRSHPLAFALLLFLLSIPVSVFGQDLRALALKLSPRNAFMKARRKQAENRLKLLHELHGNSYALTLHVFKELLREWWSTPVLALLAIAVCNYFSISNPLDHASTYLAVSALGGCFSYALVMTFAGRAFELSRLFKDLQNYEASIAKYRLLAEVGDSATEKA